MLGQFVEDGEELGPGVVGPGQKCPPYQALRDHLAGFSRIKSVSRQAAQGVAVRASDRDNRAVVTDDEWRQRFIDAHRIAEGSPRALSENRTAQDEVRRRKVGLLGSLSEVEAPARKRAAEAWERTHPKPRLPWRWPWRRQQARIERTRLRAEYRSERERVVDAASQVAGKEFRVAFREKHGEDFNKVFKQGARELRALEHEMFRLEKAKRDADRDKRKAVEALQKSWGKTRPAPYLGELADFLGVSKFEIESLLREPFTLGGVSRVGYGWSGSASTGSDRATGIGGGDGGGGGGDGGGGGG